MSTPAAYVPPVDQPPQAADAPYGGFWIRFAAYWVDGLLVTVLCAVAALLVGMVLGSDSVLGTFLVLATAQLYHAYFVSSEKMATPGKRLCGLYVTDLEGKRLSFGRALWRNVAALFSYLTLYIGFFMAGFSGRKQALHDKMAGTLVHRQPGAGGGAIVIAVVLVVVVGIAMVGILAAIAIPAYQDYIGRSKATGVITAMQGAQAPVTRFHAQNGQWPQSWEQVGYDPAAQLTDQARPLVERITLAPGGAIVADVKIANTTGQVRMASPDDGASWKCTSDDSLRKYMPAACRP